MIIVKNRELLIPENERYIGTTYDTESEVRQFRIPRFLQEGTDLSALVFRLDLMYPDETKDTVILSKEITDDYIMLTWEITLAQLQQIGTLFVQIRAADENVTVKWSSFKAAMYVESHIYTPGSYSGDLTELEQLEAQFASFANAENVRQANEATRITNENDRIAAEAARTIAENARNNAETVRDTAFEQAEAARDGIFIEAIDGFNRDRSELIEMRDASVQAAIDAETYKDICEAYADVIMPVFYVDYTDGNLKYNDSCSFTFTINHETGNLDYTLTQGA